MVDDSPTARRSIDEDEPIARALYEVMEEICDDPPGPPWSDLLGGERSWYYDCISRLRRKHVTILAGQE